jgi:uncharacterized Zn finger protein (UPF0148 family)
MGEVSRLPVASAVICPPCGTPLHRYLAATGARTHPVCDPQHERIPLQERVTAVPNPIHERPAS